MNESWNVEDDSTKYENSICKLFLAFCAPEHNFIYYSNLFFLIQKTKINS